MSFASVVLCLKAFRHLTAMQLEPKFLAAELET